MGRLYLVRSRDESEPSGAVYGRQGETALEDREVGGVDNVVWKVPSDVMNNTNICPRTADRDRRQTS